MLYDIYDRMVLNSAKILFVKANTSDVMYGIVKDYQKMLNIVNNADG